MRRYLTIHGARRRLDPLATAYWNATRGARPPIPPLRLRARVGSPSIRAFLRQGGRHVEDLEGTLRAHGHDIAEFSTILDFGCGAGRQLRELVERAPRAELLGVDLDAESIEWLRGSGINGGFVVGSPSPPLPLDDGSVDLAYAISVFTHLDETGQNAWLAELRRVCREGAILLLTTHGHAALELHRRNNQADPKEPDLESDEFRFVPYAPSVAEEYGGSYGMSYHGESYLRSVWSRYFEILGVRSAGLERHQDIVALRRR